MSRADLRGPELIHEFRVRLATFLNLGANALVGVPNELERSVDWLTHDMTSHWKRQVARTEEAYEQARLTWLAAESEVRNPVHTRGGGKQSSDEEKRDLNKARARRDHAAEMLERTRRWVVRLDQEGKNLVAQVQGHARDLHLRGLQALVQLDHLSSSVEAYQAVRASGPDPLAGLTASPTLAELLLGDGATASDASAFEGSRLVVTDPPMAPSDPLLSDPPAPNGVES